MADDIIEMDEEKTLAYRKEKYMNLWEISQGINTKGFDEDEFFEALLHYHISKDQGTWERYQEQFKAKFGQIAEHIIQLSGAILCRKCHHPHYIDSYLACACRRCCAVLYTKPEFGLSIILEEVRKARLEHDIPLILEDWELIAHWTTEQRMIRLMDNLEWSKKKIDSVISRWKEESTSIVGKPLYIIPVYPVHSRVEKSFLSSITMPGIESIKYFNIPVFQ